MPRISFCVLLWLSGISFGRASWILGVFFRAEDGIRARDVTGVQTCALPISRSDQHGRDLSSALREHDVARGARAPPAPRGVTVRRRLELATDLGKQRLLGGGQLLPGQIGRASCRERASVTRAVDRGIKSSDM